MQKFLVLIIIILLGPLGCASAITIASNVSSDSLSIDSIDSYSVEDDHIASICVSGRFHSRDIRQYSVRIPTENWSLQCLTSPGTEEEPCLNYTPISILSRSDIKKRCKTADEHQSLVVVKARQANTIVISKYNSHNISNSGGAFPSRYTVIEENALLYIDHSKRYSKVSPLIYPLLPVAIVIDILTSPQQLLLILIIPSDIGT